MVLFSTSSMGVYTPHCSRTWVAAASPHCCGNSGAATESLNSGAATESAMTYCTFFVRNGWKLYN